MWRRTPPSHDKQRPPQLSSSFPQNAFPFPLKRPDCLRLHPNTLIEPKWGPLCLIGISASFWVVDRLTFKNRGHLSSRYIMNSQWFEIWRTFLLLMCSLKPVFPNSANPFSGNELLPHQRFCVNILLMDEILHHQGWWLSHYLWGSNHPRWCRISSINSINQKDIENRIPVTFYSQPICFMVGYQLDDEPDLYEWEIVGNQY